MASRIARSRILSGIDKEKLIDLVRKHPALWDKSAPEYKIKSAKTEAWRDVCSKLNDDYENNYAQSEKTEFYLSVIKAWTTTRESWVRSLKGNTATPYLYHNKLLFLSDNITSRFKVETNNTEYEKVEYLYADDSKSKSESSDVDVKPNVSDILDKQKRNPRPSLDSDEEDFLVKKRRRLKENRQSEEVMIPFPTFEDRHLCFFKSIQPSLEKLDEDQVLEFQSGVISLLQRIRSRDIL